MQRTEGLGYKPDSIRQDYTGYQKDNESGGLEFAQARYYNTKHGRFTSTDPLTASANTKDPQAFNRYSYAMNSPYKFTDPLGLISETTGASGNRSPNNDGGFGGGMVSYYGDAFQVIQTGFNRQVQYYSTKGTAANPGAYISTHAQFDKSEKCGMRRVT